MKKIKKYTYKKIKVGGFETLKSMSKVGQSLNKFGKSTLNTTGRLINTSAYAVNSAGQLTQTAVVGAMSTGLVATQGAGSIAKEAVDTLATGGLGLITSLKRPFIMLRLATQEYETEYIGLLKQLKLEPNITIRNRIKQKIKSLVQKRIKYIQKKFEEIKKFFNKARMVIELGTEKSLRDAGCKQSMLNSLKKTEFSQRGNCPLAKFQEVMDCAKKLRIYLNEANTLLENTNQELILAETNLEIDTKSLFNGPLVNNGTDKLSVMSQKLNMAVDSVHAKLSNENPELTKLKEDLANALKKIDEQERLKRQEKLRKEEELKRKKELIKEQRLQIQEERKRRLEEKKQQEELKE
jgi:hypothetical protein